MFPFPCFGVMAQEIGLSFQTHGNLPRSRLRTFQVSRFLSCVSIYFYRLPPFPLPPLLVHASLPRALPPTPPTAPSLSPPLSLPQPSSCGQHVFASRDIIVVVVLGALSGVQGDSETCRKRGLQGLRVLHQPTEAERCTPLPSGGRSVAHNIPRVALA